MLKVKNKKQINKLVWHSLKTHKMRNLFGTIAILLTTVLFTGLFTIGSNLLTSMEESTMRQVGSSSHGSFKYLTQEEYDKIKDNKNIKEISYSIVIGIAENKELAKRPTEIRFAHDKLIAKMMFSMPEVGRLPEKEDEIALDTIVLDKLGVKPALGEKVTLSYSLDGEKKENTFTLVGFWQGDILMQASQAWVSPSYGQKQLANFKNIADDQVIGTINAEVNFSNAFKIEEKLHKVIIESGLDPEKIDIGVNWAYVGGRESLDLGMICGIVVAVLMIGLCGYLIISNVFYIYVTTDIQSYGLLKTIGTTGKQIKLMVRKEAFALCLLGVPLGLFAGYIVGTTLTPMILGILNTNVISVTLNPICFIGATLFSIITVFISITRPAKKAAQVSPIEALRRNDYTGKISNKSKKSKPIHAFSLAWVNVFRNKKKVIVVTLSLSLGLVILNSAFSMANSFDMDKYLSSRIKYDFAIGDVAYFNVHLHYFDQGTLSTTFLEELKAQAGVERMSPIYFSEYYIPVHKQITQTIEKLDQEGSFSKEDIQSMKDSIYQGKQLAHFYGLDEETLNELEIKEGTIDYEKLMTGDYVIASIDEWNDFNYYHIGDKVDLMSNEGKIKNYEIMAIAQIPDSISCRHSHSVNTEFFMPTEVFLEHIEEKAPMVVVMNVADEAETFMEAFLQHYSEEIDPNMQYESKTLLVKEYESTQKTYKVVGMTLSGLLGFIGVMNFINTMITSIFSRKKEIAMLQSVGMGNKQLGQMLIFEGLIYMLLTAVVSLTVGSGIGYLCVTLMFEGSQYFTPTFTMLPAICCLPVFGIIAIVVPVICKKQLCKKSMVERLREEV